MRSLRPPSVSSLLRAAMIVVSVALFATSSASAADKKKSTLIAVKDHWHMAFGINICGRWQEPWPASENDPLGIHTHGDGLVHAHPFVESAAGKNGVMKTFFDTEKFRVTKTSISLVGGKTFKSGEKCDGKEAVVRTLLWSASDAKASTEYTKDPGAMPFVDQQMVVWVFGPKDATISPPPSKDQLIDPADLPPPPLTAAEIAKIPKPPSQVPTPSGYTAVPPTALVLKDITKGTGAEAKKGSRPYVRYQLTLWRTKKILATTGWKPTEAPEGLYRLGNERLLPGLEKGLLGMRVGGLREITMPPKEGFGADGSGGIGPTDTITMIVQLVALK
jgi:hypothetical protein